MFLKSHALHINSVHGFQNIVEDQEYIHSRQEIILQVKEVKPPQALGEHSFLDAFFILSKLRPLYN